MNSYGPDPGLEIRLLRVLMPDRRERIATAALAGMLADRLTEEPAAVEYAKRAVKFADALIAELDKPKEVKP